MYILLTGGTGYIGCHTAVVLCGMGHKVFLIDNLSNSDIAVVQKIEHIVGCSVPFVQGDVRDTAKLIEVLAKYEIEAVIHFAGLKAVGESNEHPISYYANNVQGTISLLQAMQKQQIKTLVFSSSATVYGQPHYLPLDEAHPTGATNPYGRTKLHIEHMLQDLAASDPDWRIAILRYFNPVGAHPSGLIGEDPKGIPNNLMPYVAQVASGKLSHLNVWGVDYPTPDGTGIRDYIHVMDLAKGHAAALDYLGQHHSTCEVFNLGTGLGTSVFEMVKAFEQASGKPIPLQIAPRRPGDVAECWANPAKAQNLLGWQARLGLSDMCESGWCFVSTH